MARKASIKRKSVVPNEFQVGAILLFEIKGTQEPPDADIGESKLNVRATMMELSSMDNSHYCNIRFECGRTPSAERSSVKFEATYGFTFDCGDSDAELAAKHIAKTVVWTKFAELFAGVNAQMRARMPHLPFTPDFGITFPSGTE